MIFRNEPTRKLPTNLTSLPRESINFDANLERSLKRQVWGDVMRPVVSMATHPRTHARAYLETYREWFFPSMRPRSLVPKYTKKYYFDWGVVLMVETAPLPIIRSHLSP